MRDGEWRTIDIAFDSFESQNSGKSLGPHYAFVIQSNYFNKLNQEL